MQNYFSSHKVYIYVKAMTSIPSFAYSDWLFKKFTIENYRYFIISYLPYF